MINDFFELMVGILALTITLFIIFLSVCGASITPIDTYNSHKKRETILNEVDFIEKDFEVLGGEKEEGKMKIFKILKEILF